MRGCQWLLDYEMFQNGGKKDMILYHASKEEVEFPEVRKTRYTKDFSWGFYCTNNYEQAVRWANRGEGRNPFI